MLVFSHRGYHESLPENTLAAFQAAVELGVDGIETDVRLSVDGQAVLFHDRHAPNGRTVAELTRDELSRAVGHQIPTLGEILARWPDLTWNIEIKVPEAVPLAAQILNQFPGSRRPLVTSFWHTVVDQMRRVPQVDCGVLVAHRPMDLAMVESGWTPGLPRLTTIVWKYDVVDPQLMALARQQGYLSLAYDVESQAEHDAAAALGLDGIITDRPDFVLRSK
ncbi:MAG: glycerophosphodiester phosphodiesterase [Pirellulales bacterium]|nr:glycerophosphodiester phosphodiesterase [Pirellulales bacterium]